MYPETFTMEVNCVEGNDIVEVNFIMKVNIIKLLVSNNKKDQIDLFILRQIPVPETFLKKWSNFID